ncbi:hypothetical protein [Homoserinimonas aerilata]|uniref:hypothetical protein n=1 Tax=Homoserinimonas aerilata TaxID=1162970 RepID=UPI001154C300|nr:hypothetical protein [Homoserinimonas aerilata]
MLEAAAYGFLAVAVLATVSRWFLVARLLRRRREPSPGLSASSPAATICGGGGRMAGARTDRRRLAPLVRILLIGVAVLLAYLVIVRLLARQLVSELARVSAPPPGEARRTEIRPG